ncbi:hypothetical protein [Chitinophaga pinensis]|nr:hypothetical protein [Chitinophaga pinensis]
MDTNDRVCGLSVFNFRVKAVCFAGDVGSVTIAFWIVALLLDLILTTGNWMYILFLGVYGVDSILTIIHRLILQQNIFKAHRLHFYQILVNEQKVPHLLVATVYALVQILIIVLLLNTHWTIHQDWLRGTLILLPLVLIYIGFKGKLMQPRLNENNEPMSYLWQRRSCVDNRRTGPQNNYTVAAFFDDNATLNEQFREKTVLKYDSVFMRDCPLVIAIGNNLIRKKIVSFVEHNFCTLIDNAAFITRYVRVGEGTVVMPGAIVQAGVDIGRHVILNIGCAVDHEVSIGDFAHIGPRSYIGGGAIIGEGATIGAGAVIMRNVRIEDWTNIPPLSIVT